MIGDNGTPETPDWVPDKPRRCVLDRCACEAPRPAPRQPLTEQVIPAEGVE